MIKKWAAAFLLACSVSSGWAHEEITDDYYKKLSQPDLFYEIWNIMDIHDWRKLSQALPYLNDINMAYRTAHPGDPFYREGRHVYYDFEGATLLHIASAIGDDGDVSKGIQILIDAGADVNKHQLILPEGERERTPLDIAYHYSHDYCSKAIINTLEKNGAYALLSEQPDYSECV